VAWGAEGRLLAASADMRNPRALVEGDRAALLYDRELPEQVGTFRIAPFFGVENGKIRWYETFFDPTDFRKLPAKKSG
jgi:hypothetical protein